MESVSKGFVEEFLRHHDAEPVGIVDDTDAWVLPDGTVVQLPKGNGRIDMEQFEAIAIDQVGISYWDIDYILGQNGYKSKSKEDSPKTKEPSPKEIRTKGEI